MQRCAVQLPGKDEACGATVIPGRFSKRAGTTPHTAGRPYADLVSDGEYLVAQALEEYAELIHITSGESLRVFPG